MQYISYSHVYGHYMESVLEHKSKSVVERKTNLYISKLEALLLRMQHIGTPCRFLCTVICVTSTSIEI